MSLFRTSQRRLFVVVFLLSNYLTWLKYTKYDYVGLTAKLFIKNMIRVPIPVCSQIFLFGYKSYDEKKSEQRYHEFTKKN